MRYRFCFRKRVRKCLTCLLIGIVAACTPVTPVTVETLLSSTPTSLPVLFATRTLVQPSPTPIPTQTQAAASGATPTPTSLPTATPVGQDSLDCNLIERIPVNSGEAQRIAGEFLANFHQQFPTEYMTLEVLWSVERLGEYAALQARVTSEEQDLLLLRNSPHGYQLVARWMGTTLAPSRLMILDHLASQAPGVPQALLSCLDLKRFVERTPATELVLTPLPGCEGVERIALDTAEAQSIVDQLLGYERYGKAPIQVELGAVHSIDRQGEYAIALASFIVNGKQEPPGVYALHKMENIYRVRSVYSPLAPSYFRGPQALRSYVLRLLYGDAPDLPHDLLNCVDFDWLFE